jgi:hypothetical protein
LRRDAEPIGFCLRVQKFVVVAGVVGECSGAFIEVETLGRRGSSRARVAILGWGTHLEIKLLPVVRRM